mgnify:CR=1 FL=1
MDTFTNVGLYAQERDSSSVNVTKNTASEINFTLTDKMDDILFDYPLTVNVQVDQSWAALRATQNGKTLEAKLVNKNGNYYVTVKAVPESEPPLASIDPATVEWYVNDAKQPQTGLSFQYAPPEAGTYTVYAKQGDVQSDSRMITVEAAPPVSDKILYANDFEGTAVEVR